MNDKKHPYRLLKCYESVTGTSSLGDTTHEGTTVKENVTARESLGIDWFHMVFINNKVISLHFTWLQTRNPFAPSLSGPLFRVSKQHALKTTSTDAPNPQLLWVFSPHINVQVLSSHAQIQNSAWFTIWYYIRHYLSNIANVCTSCNIAVHCTFLKHFKLNVEH